MKSTFGFKIKGGFSSLETGQGQYGIKNKDGQYEEAVA
jgi:hypothetical protein